MGEIRKGTDDPIQNHNRFGPLADDGAMDTDEGMVRSGGQGSRTRSPVKPPKEYYSVYIILTKGQVLNT